VRISPPKICAHAVLLEHFVSLRPKPLRPATLSFRILGEQRRYRHDFTILCAAQFIELDKITILEKWRGMFTL
jgi:hypothetical protein